MLDTVFIDVGGTLWPNAFTPSPGLVKARDRRLAELLGRTVDLEPSIASMITALEATPLATPDEPRDTWIGRVFAEYGVELDSSMSRRVRQAICIPFTNEMPPFPHVHSMLTNLKNIGLKTVVVSNTAFRDAELYRQDFGVLGWAELIDDYVTSVEANCSKPDQAIFRLALDLAGSSPERCLMIGDREETDIEPAVALGMRTIRVCLEEPVPSVSKAGALVTSLERVAALVRNWTGR